MRHILLAFLLLSGSTSLQAQWRIALLSGTAATHGDARSDTDPSHPELHAERPSTLYLALAREAGAWRIGGNVHHTGADLAEVGPSSSVTTTSVLSAGGIAVEVARRVAGQRTGATLHAGVGVTFDRWSFDLDETSPRWRAAAVGLVEADLPVGGQWSAAIRAQLVAGPSVFNADELPDTFSRRTATRLGLFIGIARTIRP